MFHMQERQLLLSSLFKKPVHNAVRHFSCCNFSLKIGFDTSCKLSPKETIWMKCQILFPKETIDEVSDPIF